MTRKSSYRRRVRSVSRVKVGFLTFTREGSKAFRVIVPVDPDEVKRIVEEYAMLGWDYVRV